MGARLRIAVSASPDTNDHQARLLVDGLDWLGPGQLGLDPVDLRRRLIDVGEGRAIVGRCTCGVIGCGDVQVDVLRSADNVTWRAGDQTLEFDIADYDAELHRFAHDTSWETLGRTVEREVAALFADTVAEGGRTLDWASTRIRPGAVHLSFSRDGQPQLLLEFDWDEVSPDAALERARAFRRERFGRG